MRTSIATVSLSGSLEQKLAAAAGAGFDAVELFEPDLIASPSRPDAVRQLAADLGLELAMYQPFRDFEGVDDDVLKRNLRRARAKFELMQELGTPTLLVCSSVRPDAIDDPARSADQLARLADLAAEHGVRVAFEALAWGTHVNDYRDAWQIVARADHPNLGTCLDSFHILSRDSDPAAIEDIPGEKIFFVQLADAPLIRLEVLQWSRHHRCFPGQGDFDLAGFMDHVAAAGYDGPWSLEVFNDVFRQADPERIAVDAMRSLTLLGESTGARRPLAPAEVRGHAFAELAVGPDSAPATEEVLASMGFAHVGPHRTKPVQLWEQGDARVLLNHGEPGDDEPLVAALGVESTDPSHAAARAEELFASPLPRRRGPGEADLTAVAAPDGTSVFFCRTERAGDGWLADFVDLDGRHDDGGLVHAIDHVVLAQPFDYFDEAALFYRSVLGLQSDPSEDLAGPDGLLRSRSLSDPSRALRLAVTVPRLGGGTYRRPVELQHIAFASRDTRAAAETMRERGLPVLAIPDNYYDDLAGRTELDDGRIDALRDLDVLYDADGAGEFLHFFTEMVGDRLFFEVVERRGDYDGYGAANSAVRLAAQATSVASHGVTG